MKIYLKVTFAFFLLAISNNSFAQTSRSWDGGGSNTNWSTAANWAGDIVPGPDDNVFISLPSPGYTITLSQGAECNSITIGENNNGTNNRGALTLQLNGNQLIVRTSLTYYQASLSTGSRTINIGAGTLAIGENFFIQNPSNATTNSVNITSGTLKVGGVWTVGTGLSFSRGEQGFVEFNGAVNQSIPNLTYRNLRLSGSGLKSFSGASTISGDMYVETGARVDPFPAYVHTARSLALGGVGKPIGKYGGEQSTATGVTKNNIFFGFNSSTSSSGAIETAAISPLPVTLSSFTAKPTTDNKVSLAWVTSSESVNKGFSIERQEEGNGKFQSLGFIPSKAEGGNSQTTLAYSFKDMTPKKGTNMYRLVQEDLDGKKTYSEVRIVKLNNQSVSMVFPNPSNGSVNISRTADGKKMNIQVIDQSGKIIRQVNNITDANYKLNIPQSGIYSIKMTYPETGEQSIQRVVVQK